MYDIDDSLYWDLYECARNGTSTNIIGYPSTGTITAQAWELKTSAGARALFEILRTCSAFGIAAGDLKTRYLGLHSHSTWERSCLTVIGYWHESWVYSLFLYTLPPRQVRLSFLPMSRDPVTTKCLVSQQYFHPNFNDATGDTVLSSNQGTLFCMPRILLRTTSGLLRLFLSDNTNESSKPSYDTSRPDFTGPSELSATTGPTDAISLPFDDAPIERVLLILRAQPTDPWTSFAELEAAVDVMEYLDTPGPLSFVRASCFMPVFALEPIRLYGLAVKFGWDEVVQYAGELTLTLNLLPSSSDTTNSDQNKMEGQLTRLASPALYRLLKYHRCRRDEFRALIYSAEIFGVGNAQHINCSCGAEINNGSWRELRSRLVWEVDQNPSGRTILGLEMEEMEESTRCWKAKCSRCNSCFYNRLETLKNIRACVERLPKRV